jgi:SpoVK/Ycf46/Vps4 family AAA+-type ATPase
MRYNEITGFQQRGMMCKWKGEKWRKEKERGLRVLFKELYENSRQEIIIKEIKKYNTEDEG